MAAQATEKLQQSRKLVANPMSVPRIQRAEIEKQKCFRGISLMGQQYADKCVCMCVCAINEIVVFFFNTYFLYKINLFL